MGVPAFFRWLSMRCPSILIDAKESIEENGMEIEEDNGNPEIDNLYLDMNGIIHPCTHPEGNQAVPKPLSEREMFLNIFKYIDKLMRIVKPQKILYMAIDGVAPRAKMNQQRGRRFKSALDRKLTAEKMTELKRLWKEKKKDGFEFLEEFEDSQFDSNLITPGTEFMDRLSIAIQAYIVARVSKDPKWKNLKVFYSDATLPGEGEHKILEFLRLQRSHPDYNANVRHCIYGADADLIMLGLSTHEPHFYIIREVVLSNQTPSREPRSKQGEFDELEEKQILVEFQFVVISVYREYLDLEFSNLEIPFAYDLESVVDDFVLLAFLVGNDFLPHLPCLNIRQAGIDVLLFIYKNVLPNVNGYLTEGCKLHLDRVSELLDVIAKVEPHLVMQEESFKVFSVLIQDYNKRKNQAEEFQKQKFAAQNDRNSMNDQAAELLRKQFSVQETQSDNLQKNSNKFLTKEDALNEFKSELKRLMDVQ